MNEFLDACDCEQRRDRQKSLRRRSGCTELTRYAFNDVILGTRSDLLELFESISVSAEKRAVAELIEQGMDGSDLLTGSLSEDGRENGRSERARLVRGEEGAKVKELAQENELGLCLSLRIIDAWFQSLLHSL